MFGLAVFQAEVIVFFSIFSFKIKEENQMFLMRTKADNTQKTTDDKKSLENNNI